MKMRNEKLEMRNCGVRYADIFEKEGERKYLCRFC